MNEYKLLEKSMNNCKLLENNFIKKSLESSSLNILRININRKMLGVSYT